MKTSLPFILLILLSFTSLGQISTYDYVPKQPILNTYVPKTDAELRAIAAHNAKIKAEREAKFKIYMEEAVEGYNQKDYERSIFFLDMAEKYGYNSFLYYLKGLCYKNLNKTGKAKAALRKAKSLGSYDAARVLKEEF